MLCRTLYNKNSTLNGNELQMRRDQNNMFRMAILVNNLTALFNTNCSFLANFKSNRMPNTLRQSTWNVLFTGRQEAEVEMSVGRQVSFELQLWPSPQPTYLLQPSKLACQRHRMQQHCLLSWSRMLLTSYIQGLGPVFLSSKEIWLWLQTARDKIHGVSHILSDYRQHPKLQRFYFHTLIQDEIQSKFFTLGKERIKKQNMCSWSLNMVQTLRMTRSPRSVKKKQENKELNPNLKSKIMIPFLKKTKI